MINPEDNIKIDNFFYAFLLIVFVVYFIASIANNFSTQEQINNKWTNQEQQKFINKVLNLAQTCPIKTEYGELGSTNIILNCEKSDKQYNYSITIKKYSDDRYKLIKVSDNNNHDPTIGIIFDYYLNDENNFNNDNFNNMNNQINNIIEQRIKAEKQKFLNE